MEKRGKCDERVWQKKNQTTNQLLNTERIEFCRKERHPRTNLQTKSFFKTLFIYIFIYVSIQWLISPHLVARYNVYTHHRNIINRINPKLQAKLFSGVWNGFLDDWRDVRVSLLGASERTGEEYWGTLAGEEERTETVRDGT